LNYVFSLHAITLLPSSGKRGEEGEVSEKTGREGACPNNEKKSFPRPCWYIRREFWIHRNAFGIEKCATIKLHYRKGDQDQRNVGVGCPDIWNPGRTSGTKFRGSWSKRWISAITFNGKTITLNWGGEIRSDILAVNWGWLLARRDWRPQRASFGDAPGR